MVRAGGSSVVSLRADLGVATKEGSRLLPAEDTGAWILP
jgi:hypothetical protein